MWLIGKWGGKAILKWIISKKDIDQSMHLLTIGGKALLPAAYLLPGFPDDTLSLVAGMTNISFLYSLVCTVIFRGIGILFICFLGSDFLDYSAFAWYEWIIFIVSILAMIALLAYISYIYFKHLRHKEEGDAFFLKYRLKVKEYSVRQADDEDLYTLRKIMKKSIKAFNLPLKKMTLRELYAVIETGSVCVCLANSSEKAFCTVTEENGKRYVKDVYYTDSKALMNMLMTERRESEGNMEFEVFADDPEIEEELSRFRKELL